jgi:hypothetical protein
MVAAMEGCTELYMDTDMDTHPFVRTPDNAHKMGIYFALCSPYKVDYSQDN